jgi:monoamine oxidase
VPMKSVDRVLIIGGGLSGLSLAFFLQKKGIETIILEASNRLGGRIHTVTGSLGTPLELGATWFSNIHTSLLQLADELRVRIYPQYSEGISLFQTKSFEPAQEFFIPESASPSYRIVGGTQILIRALIKKLTPECIYLNKRVTTIQQENDCIVVGADDDSTFKATKVVICIPPQLAGINIQFSPALPASIAHILPTVQTWMAGSVKFTIEYDEPFWRKGGYSGTLYSHAGVIIEMYDHTNYEENKYGFTGFLNSSSAAYSHDVRKEFVLQQLGELLGPKVMKPIAYFDKVWNDEFILDGGSAILRPHQNNGHPVFSSSYMDGCLHFCGTETAPKFSGYMEGAIIAAKHVSERL